MPKISVLMTVFNAESFLYESLQSLVNQSFSDWEAIVIENGSIDASKEILSGFSDIRIKPFYLAKNIGRTEALKMALSYSESKYIAILDADDVAVCDRFFIEYHKLESDRQIGLVGSWSAFIDVEGKVLQIKTSPEDHDSIVKRFAVQNPFVHSSVMFRRDVAISVGGYNSNFEYAQDFDLILRIAAVSKVEIIPEMLCKWRLLENSQTSSPKSSVIRAHDEYLLFKQANKLHNFDILARSANFKQIFITRFLYVKALLMNRNHLQAIKIAFIG
jgi:glycosyltransferase involved in cell wall biosynthesis